MALSAKHQAFVDRYLIDFNATEAYMNVYHPATRETAGVNGHRLLKNAKVAEAIQQRLDELTMSTNEALLRLTEHGRAEYARYSDSDGSTDIGAMIADGKAHLIKGVKETQYGRVVEFHDVQTAIDKILRVRGAYVDRHEHSGPSGGPIQTAQEVQVNSDAEHIADVLRTLVEVGAIELPPTSQGGDAEAN